jgi:sec-independent protein translocase protein TatA
MFDIGGGEIFFIVIVILLLFGPKKIPEMARTVTNGLQKLKNAQKEFSKEFTNIKDEMDQSIKDAERQAAIENSNKSKKQQSNQKTENKEN